MMKFTNIVGCLTAGAIFGMLAKGEIDQSLLRNSMLWVYWAPCLWFAVGAFINLAKKD